MKPLLPNSSLSKRNSLTLVEDGKVLTEPSEVVEVFNNYFASVAVPETHRGSVETFSDHPSVLGIASRQVLEHPFTFEPVSSSYAKEILDNLNPWKAVGADGISLRLLRLSGPVMAEEITRLINFLIANRSWPGKWKCGNLTPCSRRVRTCEKRTIALCRSLRRRQRSMRKLCTINFITLSVATCHKTLWISKGPFVLHRSSENDRE